MAASIEYDCGVDLEQDVGDVLELDVVDVRAVAAAPAGVEADLVLGQPVERVVDDLDVELQQLAVLVDRVVRVEHPGGEELRLVDLDDQPGVGDGPVLLADGFRDGRMYASSVG